ncbi:MAG TPA: DNA-binding response regulator [Clostridiales bacterium]|nr:MAG: DNA-binding response regulator [Clostridiales bacterium GWD2_32_19]HCC07202.1 DNA-binding response regulator [Clostridiales bacterium]
MNDNPKKILIVDDESKIVEVVKSYLEVAGYITFDAYNGRQALEIFDKVKPSLVILDLMLPDVSGEDVCKSLRRISKVPIIMVTAKVEEESILKGLDIGADDYITKPFSPRQLVARVITLLRRSEGGNNVFANILSWGNEELEINLTSHEVIKDGKLVNLTPNEYKILITLCTYSKKVFTREELVISSLGEQYDGYDRTIDTHIKNLRQKLEANPKNSKYILTVYGVGYRFGGE